MSNKKRIEQKEKEQREREWFDCCIRNGLSYDEFRNGCHPTTAREIALQMAIVEEGMVEYRDMLISLASK